MKAKRYPARKNCWQIIVPARLNGGRRQRKYFKTRELAEAEINRLEHRGPASQKIQLDGDEAAMIQIVRSELGGSLKLLLDAARHFRLTVLNATKQAHLFELFEKFLERQEHEERRPRTIDDDRQRLRKFCDALGNVDVRQITESMVRQYLDSYKPGGDRKSHHKAVKKFLRWAYHIGYLALDVTARIKSVDKWGVNNEIVPIEDFRRLLFVTAGLEPITPGEAPTMRYIGFLSFFVLGGLAGMRRAELLRDRNSQSILEWSDILWDKNLISIRDKVAKQTRAADRRRLIPLEPAAKEWLLLIKGISGPVVNIWQSTHTKLTRELFGKLEIDLPENGLRNSYASYAQTFRSAGEVAKACGDLESTIRRFYTQLLESGTGKAWFDIRPNASPKIISIAV